MGSVAIEGFHAGLLEIQGVHAGLDGRVVHDEDTVRFGGHLEKQVVESVDQGADIHRLGEVCLAARPDGLEPANGLVIDRYEHHGDVGKAGLVHFGYGLGARHLPFGKGDVHEKGIRGRLPDQGFQVRQRERDQGVVAEVSDLGSMTRA
jgi:hypothetical protein